MNEIRKRWKGRETFDCGVIRISCRENRSVDESEDEVGVWRKEEEEKEGVSEERMKDEEEMEGGREEEEEVEREGGCI